MSHLESLTKKLHALLPELTELKFGCRMIHFWDHFDGSHETEFVILLKEDRRNTFHVYDPKTKKFDHLENLVEEEFEILGHPITLEDVLKALGLCNPDIMISESNGRNGGFVGSFNESGDLISHELHDLLYMWNFGLTLNQQNPKLHEFLDNLIPDPTSK